MDGVWGSCLQPSQGLFWYRIPDSGLLTAICRVYNDWIAEFCKPYPRSPQGHRHAQRRRRRGGVARSWSAARSSGWSGRSFPSRRWPTGRIATRSTTASGGRRRTSGMPLLLHIGTPRGGIPGCEFTMDLGELTGAGRSTTDYWVRYSLSAMIFAGVFDRYPEAEGRLGRARGGVDSSLAQADGLHLSRAAGVHPGLAVAGGAAAERLLAPQHVRGVHGGRPRRPAARRRSASTTCSGAATSRTPSRRGRSPGTSCSASSPACPRPDLRKITSENAARMFGFKLN